MITLILNTSGPLHCRIQVLLDIGPGDFVVIGETAQDIVLGARIRDRKAGCVLRDYGGETWFTYEPSSQALLELQLVAQVCSSPAFVEAGSQSGGGAQCNTY